MVYMCVSSFLAVYSRTMQCLASLCPFAAERFHTLNSVVVVDKPHSLPTVFRPFSTRYKCSSAQDRFYRSRVVEAGHFFFFLISLLIIAHSFVLHFYSSFLCHLVLQFCFMFRVRRSCYHGGIPGGGERFECDNQIKSKSNIHFFNHVEDHCEILMLNSATRTVHSIICLAVY